MVALGREDLSPFHRCKEGDSDLPWSLPGSKDVHPAHLETLLLVPCPALSPFPSLVPEPAALPGHELREGGQTRTGEVSPVISNTSRSLLQASTPASERAWDVLKIVTCRSVTLPLSPSPEWEVFVLHARAAWAGGGRRGSGVGRQVPSAGLFLPSWPGALGLSGYLRKGWI